MSLPEVRAADVRVLVRRIVASPGFAAAESIRRLLEFTVEKTLSGHGGEIKEFTLGMEVFGRKASFDPQSDSIVRVQARKLRERLLVYYESEGAHDSIRIQYRKGSYVPQFLPAAAGEVAPMRSLAVLPFVNLGPGRDNDYLCDGITEELIFLLSRTEGLRIVSRTSCFALRAANDDIRTIGQKLNAQLVVEGTVRQVGDRVRVTAQLIDTEDGYHLWSERWERGMDRVNAIQDEIADAIASALRPRVAVPASAPAPTRDLEAYRLFLKGRYFWNQRTEHGLQRALEHYRAVIGRDQDFARAWAAMADTYVLMAAHQLESPATCMPRAREAALTALRLDERLAEAHAALAACRMSFDLDREGAEREWKTALDIDPNYAHAWHGLSVFGTIQGQTDDAVRALRHAQRLEPLSAAIACDFGFLYYWGRRYAEAIEHCHQALDLHPSFYRTYAPLARSHAAMGLYRDAIEACLSARRLFSGRAFLAQVLATLGYSYGRLGQHAEALAVLVDLREMGAPYVSPIDVAIVHVGLGDRREAMKCLEEAFRQRAFWLMALPREALFDDLRTDPRFAEMCKAV